MHTVITGSLINQVRPLVWQITINGNLYTIFCFQ